MNIPSVASVLADLAPTLFSGGPKDIVATPDVYGITSDTLSSSKVINTSVGKFNPFNSQSLNNLRSGSVGILSSLTSMANLSSLVNTVPSFSNSSTLSRLTSVMGVSTGGLSATFQQTLMQATGLNSGSYGSVLVNSGGLLSEVTTTDVPGTIQTLSTLNMMAGSTLATTTDVGAQNTATSAITTVLIGLGLSGLLASFIQSQTASGSTTAASATVALQQNVQQAIQASDLATIQLCITNLGVGGVLAQVPDAPLQIVKAYAIPANTPSTGYAALWTQLNGILIQLAPNWQTMQWAGATYPSLAYFTGASADCLKVMQTSGDPTIVTSAIIGPSYQPEPSLSTLSQMYPYMLQL